jgi:hypothetical protein
VLSERDQKETGESRWRQLEPPAVVAAQSGEEIEFGCIQTLVSVASIAEKAFQLVLFDFLRGSGSKY